MMPRTCILLIFTFFICCCNNRQEAPDPAPTTTDTVASTKTTPPDTQIIHNRFIPVLCYHRIVDNPSGKSPDYTISTAMFKAHIKALADSGYTSMLPEALYGTPDQRKPLPEKPVMISFDDSRVEHATIAAPELERYGFKGVFFIMTVALGRPNYLSTEQLKQLAVQGHSVGVHTWNHPDLRKINEADWETQVTKPKQKLEQITGRPIVYLAYPFGLWNEEVAAAVKARGYTAAFQLLGKQSTANPLFSVRRILVPGTWSPARLLQTVKQTQRAYASESRDATKQQ